LDNLYISIIIPCYNEEKIISLTHEKVKNILEKNNFNYEIIYINDGSIDNTSNILDRISKNDSKIKIINFSRNFGHQAAVSAGINNCSGDVAIIIDADLQDPPEVFPEMINIYIKEKCNIVYGVRKSRLKESFLKKITAKVFYRFINFISETKLNVDTGDFRLIDKKVIESFKNLKEKNKYIRGLMNWVGFKQCPIYYDRDQRLYGKTKYTLSKMIKLATTGIFYFSKKPLKIAFSFGFICITLSLLLVIYVFISKFYFPETTIAGWASILITIIFFGGVQLFIVGILGEYIGSIFDEVKNRPEYIIDNMKNFKKNVKK
jgi:dolichol-phosphate mannosyltransferase